MTDEEEARSARRYLRDKYAELCRSSFDLVVMLTIAVATIGVGHGVEVALGQILTVHA